MKRKMHLKLLVYILSLLTTLVSFSGAVEISNSVDRSISLPSNPVVKRGDSKEAVDKLLGYPKGGFKAENEETVYYDRGYVLYRDGKVVKWSLLTDEEILAKRRSDENISSSVVSARSIPRSSPQELAYREKLSQQQQLEREQERLREIPYYERGEKERKQYQEDAAFMRNLFSEGKSAGRQYVHDGSEVYPVNRASILNEDAFAVTPQVRYRNYVSSETVVPPLGNQGYVNDDISTPQIQRHGYVNNSFSANRIGSSTYFSDGSSSQRIGNGIYFNNGVSAQQLGNGIYFNNGLSAQQLGNGIYFNNGLSAQRIGDGIYFNNGVSAQRIGDGIYFNNGVSAQRIGR